jgi:DNA (cytosine-5)-methyltransferase 1
LGGARVKALDLFCGAGGASMGLHRAGFDVVGVDIAPMPEYPFEFVRGDATRPPVRLDAFDFIWASPPCQAYTPAAHRYRIAGKEYPDLVAETRTLLAEAGVPYIIENVPQAPLRSPVALTGPMFGLKVIRRRHFEIGRFHAEQPRIPNPAGSVVRGDFEAVYGNSGTHDWSTYKRWRRRCNTVEPKRVPPGTLKTWREAMDINWMGRARLTQAVPPAYSEYLASEFLRTGVGA